MIIDIPNAITFYLIVTVMLVIACWIFYNCINDTPLTEQQQFLEQCPYCTFVFFDYKNSNIKILDIKIGSLDLDLTKN